MFKQTIKINILIIFLTLLGLISIALLSSQYYFNNKIATSSTEKTFKLITSSISNHIHSTAARINTVLKSNVNNLALKQDITFEIETPVLNDFVNIMKMNPYVLSTYFVHKDASFYQVINMKSAPQLYNMYNAPQESRWMVVINKDSKLLYAFLNKKNLLISKKFAKKTYDPLSRPWYKNAMKSNHPLITPPYHFSTLDDTGVTYSTKIARKGSVFAIDYTMKSFNKLLTSQKFEDDSEIFIYDQKGTILVSSTESKISNDREYKIDTPLMESFSRNEQGKIIKYNDGSTNYFTIYNSIGKKNIYNLAIKLNADNLIKPYNDNMTYSFSIALLLILLSLPIIFLLTNLIVRPIQLLIKENEKIEHREFSKVTQIKTNIIEFEQLSNSFVVMSQSIQEYQKSQADLLDSIVKLIAEAVDAKSPYTGGHCKRVPEIAQMLVDEASKSQEGIFKEFSLTTEDELREFEIGAWLHDCGKVTTPEYVIDKSTKLETINDRIHEVRTRFEVLWRDEQIQYLQVKLDGGNEEKALESLNSAQAKLIEDFTFIANTNIGGEFMSEERQERVRTIANREWLRHFDDSLGLGEVEALRYDIKSAQSLPATEKLLSDKKQHIIKRENFDCEAYDRDGFKGVVPEHLYNYGEVYNLCIAKGTLSDEERYKINEHVIMTIKMLEKIPFPSQMTKIPEYAGTHHETLIGSGYPRGLTKDELSIPARIMALSDVFEALTASDRPYKKAKTLSASVKILSFMVKDKHLDEDIFKLFLKSSLHVEYAKRYLKEEQIDEVDIEQYI